MREEGRGRPKSKKNRKSVNIAFARGLSSTQLGTILQLQLLRARGATPSSAEVTLPTEIVHDIKFRLRYYARLFGEVDRKEFFESDDHEPEVTDGTQDS